MKDYSMLWEFVAWRINAPLSWLALFCWIVLLPMDIFYYGLASGIRLSIMWICIEVTLFLFWHWRYYGED